MFECPLGSTGMDSGVVNKINKTKYKKIIPAKTLDMRAPARFSHCTECDRPEEIGQK
jgi:hypothetical protein